MRVIVSVAGRFHAFDLARQLGRRGSLEKLITSFPAWRAVRAGVPAGLVKSLPLKEVIFRVWRKTPRPLRDRLPLQYLSLEIFDRQAGRALSPCDLFIGWSGNSLNCLRKASQAGATTIVERGSPHILHAQEILEEEYRRVGVRWPGIHPRIVAKELSEYREADFIVVPSEFARRSFLEMGTAPQKVVKIVLGVNLELFRPLPKRDAVFRVIFVGSVSINKGVHYLLRAFSELALPNSELVLVGPATGEIKPVLNRFRGRFRHVGGVPQHKLAAYYSQGSVFAIMSLTEGLAMVQPQAMACGLPVICTTNTGGEDIVRDGKDGFVIPVRDTEALKEKIIFLYENPDVREQMSRSARQRVAEGFSWNDYGERALAAYRRMIGATSRRAAQESRGRRTGAAANGELRL